MTAYTLKSAFLSGLVAATSLMASTALAQEYQWTFQTSAQAGDNFFPIEEAWADRVKELSDGRIEITVVPVGTGVAHNETLDAVGAGILQGHITDPSYFSGKDPAFAMLGNLVGAWSAPEQMFDYMENGGGKALFNDAQNEPLPAAINRGHANADRLMRSEDSREGIAAYAEKRDANFRRTE